jgi:hypothetical protein
MEAVQCRMDVLEALGELIATVTDPDFEGDAAAMLAAWGRAASGAVGEGDRYRLARDPELANLGAGRPGR